MGILRRSAKSKRETRMARITDFGVQCCILHFSVFPGVLSREQLKVGIKDDPYSLSIVFFSLSRCSDMI